MKPRPVELRALHDLRSQLANAFMDVDSGRNRSREGDIEMNTKAQLRQDRAAMATVAQQLASLETMTVGELAEKFREVFGFPRRPGLSRARVTQLLDLTLLAPHIQERILFAESVDGLETTCERTLRAVARAESWKCHCKQLAAASPWQAIGVRGPLAPRKSRHMHTF
jgi:hypothetical protein